MSCTSLQDLITGRHLCCFELELSGGFSRSALKCTVKWANFCDEMILKITLRIACLYQMPVKIKNS